MAKGIVNILTDKIFPASAPANQTENNSLKTLLFSQPITKGAADDAISRITEKFAARQTAPASQAAAVEKSDDEKTEKTLADFFKEICARQPFDYDKLAKQSVTLEMKTTKPVEKMTLADYIQAKDRAIYKQAGYNMLTDAEIRAAADMVAAKFPVHNTNFGLNNLHKLDALAGAMTLTTNKATIEYAVRAGQAMLQYWDYQAKAIVDAVEKGKDYVNGALGGFVEKPYNAVVNNINGLSEPFRAGEQRFFGTSYLPELPRSTVGDRSEYWQQKRYGGVSLNMIGEGATTIQVGIMTGRPLYNSRLGALLGVQVGTYNVGVGATGNDPLHPGRQMSNFERGSRIVGCTMGVVSAPFSPGGRALSNDALAFPNAARNTVRNLDEIFRPPTNPPLAPAGNVPGRFGTRIFTDKTPIQKMGEPMEISISADEANLDHITSGKKPPYGATRARDIVLDKETVFVRVHGEDNQTRSWMMRKEDIEGLTATQIKDKFALPELPKYVSDVHVPKGTRMVVGTVAEQKGWGKGGAIQYEAKDIFLPKSAFRNRRLLPK